MQLELHRIYQSEDRLTATEASGTTQLFLRTVTVCPRWDEFGNFLSDMGRKPEGGHVSLDREDNANGYSPDNCRWSNPTEQNRNKGNNVIIESTEYGKKPLAEWACLLMARTGNNWTARRLQSALQLMTIDEVPRGLDIKIADCAEHEPIELVAA